MRSDLVVLESYPNGMVARLVKGRLEEAWLAVFLDDDTESAQQPAVALPSWTSIRLLVHERDLERARSVLATSAAGRATDA